MVPLLNEGYAGVHVHRQNGTRPDMHVVEERFGEGDTRTSCTRRAAAEIWTVCGFEVLNYVPATGP